MVEEVWSILRTQQQRTSLIAACGTTLLYPAMMLEPLETIPKEQEEELRG